MSFDTYNNGFAPVKELQWLFFDLNSYFASVEQQDQPELRNKPIAIVPSETDATCAIAASYEAKAYGIKTGTKIYDAKKMCPDLICVLARHDKYVEYHHRIFDEVENHIPISKVCSVDEAACLLMDNEKEPEQATAIALKIKAGLKENIGDYIRCSIGIAPSMFLAKTATDMQKPDGLVVLEPNSYHTRLFQMRLGDLCGIGRNMERRLNCSGIHTIKQLWNISPKHARKIWRSVAGERFWYRLHGYEVPDNPTKKRVVGHSRVLDPPHRNSDKAYSLAKQLSVKACTRLRRYGLYARKFSLSVKTQQSHNGKNSCWSQEISFAPTQDNFTILRALHDFWTRMQYDTHKARLLKVSVSLYDLYEPQDMTLDLFETAKTSPQAQQDARLSQAIDTINQRYGKQSVNIGTCPKTSAGYVGTKIAFTRVPEMEEF